MNDKNEKSQFFKETFLLADISMDIAFRIFFLILNNVKVNFSDWKLRSRSYIIVKAFFTIGQVELIEKKEFIATTYDLDNNIFIVHITSFASFNIYLSCKTQITSLKTNEIYTTVLSKYADFPGVFFLDLATKLSEYTEINNYAINRIDSKQQTYRPIYSLR